MSCGKVTKITDYSRMQVAYSTESGERGTVGVQKEISQDSIARARRKIYEIVEGNFLCYPFPVFCTFTFKKNITDIDFSFMEMRNFLRRYSRFKLGNERALEYIGVAERQKRGAVHFHFVFFNLPYGVENERSTREMAKIWNFGFVDVRDASKTLSGSEVFNLGAYLAKYLAKDNVARFGKAMYFASRGLARPVVELSPFPFAINHIGSIIRELRHDSCRGCVRTTIYSNV